MNKTLLNTKQVASLFKVDTSTVRRWSLSGKLKCSSSRGGHRRFAYKNIIDFLDVKDKNLSLDLSELNKISNTSTKNNTIEILANNALDRKYKVIESTLIKTYLQGISIPRIFDDYLDKSLELVQSMLDDKKISVAEEHISRKTISKALGHFKNAIIKDTENSKTNVLCLNLENDIPDIAIDMVQIVLETKSYKVFNSGANTCIKDLKMLLNKEKYDHIYIFKCNRQCCDATAQSHFNETISSLELINNLCEEYNIKLHIGGPATNLIDDKVSFKYNKFLKFSDI